MTSRIESALTPFDALRQVVMRALLARPALREALVRREQRVPLVLAVCACSAFACALLAPSLQLVWAPLVFGVPHLAADLRYLVLRRALPRRSCWTHGVFIGGTLMLAAWQLARSGAPFTFPIEHSIGCAWLMFGAVAGAATAQRGRAAPYVLAAALALIALAIAWPRPFQLVLMHGHNLVALVIWFFLFRRRVDRWGSLVMLGALAAAGFLASGHLLSVTMRHGWLSVSGLHLFAAADFIAPGIGDMLGVGVTTSFGYLQSLHYAIWLIAIPQEDTRAAGSTTFRMSWRGSLRDFGPWGLSAVCVLGLLALLGGSVNPLRARYSYIALSGFHAWLELALLAYYAARGGLTRPARASA